MCLLGLAAVLSGHCVADMVLVHGTQRYPLEEEAIGRLAGFYGITLQTMDAGTQEGIHRGMTQLRNPATVAVLVSQEALSRLDKRQLQSALRRANGLHIPMLVFGVHAQGAANELKFWSGGAVHGCAPLESDFRPTVLEVWNAGTVTRMLSGEKLPAVASPTCSLQFDQAPGIQPVLSAAGNGGRNSAVLVRAQTGAADVFFVPRLEPFDVSWIGKPDSLTSAFSSMAPFLLFMSYSAGDLAWHSDGSYGNLTIDDAWLTQPYGHLDYPALLAEMDQHNFHTTLAFIPWNFDRSEPELIALFRKHPDRFSVCMHGNNHDHREFGDYSGNPLPDQIADIKQGIARMERFQTLTAISYDRFMVFPHGVAPEQTFAAIKSYGFLGTANSQNVPIGVAFPTDPVFLLRPYTVAYADILSLSRYPAGGGVSRSDIAIQAFLGNPLLFYGHEDLFENGIGAFNRLADLVNHVQPDTRWTSLGEIARHSYLIRRRQDSGFDVRMFSNEMDLRNPTDKDAVFYIQRDEDISPPIRLLTIDGSPFSFERSRAVLTLHITVPARQVRKLRITYENDFNPSHEDIRKRSVYVFALRTVSDFRDLRLSRSSWGAAITKAYYRHDWDSVEGYLERKWWVCLVCIGLAFVGLRYRRWRAGKARHEESYHELNS
jgi:peptidoglycan/xylan/chitin deacetylase (PgdA/CDA1 family)